MDLCVSTFFFSLVSLLVLSWLLLPWCVVVVVAWLLLGCCFFVVFLLSLLVLLRWFFFRFSFCFFGFRFFFVERRGSIYPRIVEVCNFFCVSELTCIVYCLVLHFFSAVFLSFSFTKEMKQQGHQARWIRGGNDRC